MSVGRSLWSGLWVVFVMAAVGCMLLLAACDMGAPASTQTTPAPTTGSGAPSIDASPTETDALSELLTQMPAVLTATDVPTPIGLSDTDRVNIFTSVIDALLGEKVPANIYINPYLGAGERLDEPNESQPVPQGLLSALAKADTGPKYELSEFKDAIGPLDDGGVVKNNGAFITLGAIMGDPSDKDAVTVRGSIYRKEGDAQGDRFRFKRDASARGGWKLLASTQEWAE